MFERVLCKFRDYNQAGIIFIIRVFCSRFFYSSCACAFAFSGFNCSFDFKSNFVEVFDSDYPGFKKFS